jgi:hypothetical protein
MVTARHGRSPTRDGGAPLMPRYRDAAHGDYQNIDETVTGPDADP